MKFVKKIVLRRALARMIRSEEFGAVSQKDAIGKVRKDADLLDQLQERVEEMVNSKLAKSPGSVPKGEMPFLQWLWDHRAEIWAMILQLLKMI